ncbi:hypothetical protein J6590_015102 [Homalodisca vitripennis]|nr:hypothetical protein J6590_015102 [Homalodisca vitripennis]
MHVQVVSDSACTTGPCTLRQIYRVHHSTSSEQRSAEHGIYIHGAYAHFVFRAFNRTRRMDGRVVRRSVSNGQRICNAQMKTKIDISEPAASNACLPESSGVDVDIHAIPFIPTSASCHRPALRCYIKASEEVSQDHTPVTCVILVMF